MAFGPRSSRTPSSIPGDTSSAIDPADESALSRLADDGNPHHDDIEPSRIPPSSSDSATGPNDAEVER